MNHTLIATLTGRPHANLRVEAWDADSIVDDLVDVAVTDGRGRFEMELHDDYVAATFSDPTPTLVFRIFQNGKLVAAKPVAWRITQQVTQLQIPITAGAASSPTVLPAPAVVRGTIRDGHGRPVAQRVVRAFDRNLGASGFVDTQLGQDTTADDGQYEIPYTMPAVGKLKPDLIVRVDATALVINPPGTAPRPMVGTPVHPPTVTPNAVGTAPPPPPAPARPPAAESTLHSNASTVVVIDLGLGGSIDPVRSEHGKVADSLRGMLERSTVALADLRPEHLDYVGGGAGVQPDRLALMVQAAQLAREAGGTVDPEIFYGLLRAGFRGGLDALVEPPISVLRAQIEHAIDQNLISTGYAPKLDEIVAALHDLAVARAVPATGETPISAALAGSLAPPEVHQAFVRTWIGRDGSGDDVWDAVRADPKLAPHAGELETATRLHILFGGFQPAIAELRARRQAGRLKSLRDLARWQDADWSEFLAKTGLPPGIAGDTPAEKTANYAKGLQAVVRGSFPTEYVRGRAGAPVAPLSIKFLPVLAEANPDLDLARPLPDDPSWGAIAAADQPAARAEWEALQREARTFRRVPARQLLASVVAANGANPLRAAAHQVLVGSTVDLENVTVEEHLAATPALLNGVAAEHRNAVVHHLKATQRLLRIAEAPEAVEHLMADGLDSAHRIARVPRGVFVERYAGVLGDTAAAHRAYSAAFRTATTAQLALATVTHSIADASPWAVRGGSTARAEGPDHAGVLALLKNHARADEASWPALFGADAWCDCDECQSALGPAAYFVDLVHMIDPDDKEHTPADRLFKRRPDLEYLPLTCGNTNTAIPYIDLVNEILEAHIASRIAGVAVKPSYDSTGLSADELRAVPQNVIPEVYRRLATNPYPFTLPFDRSLAVMRSYLDQLGTSYGELFDAFGPRAPNDDLSHAEHLAAEALGLSRRQFKLIAGMATAAPADTLPELYGFDKEDPGWRATLASVPELLGRTGITYDELHALVHTFFLNPSHVAGVRLALEHPVKGQIDGTHLKNATDVTWDRLHRFVRLWRATSWSIADLDRVVFAVGAHADDHSVVLDHGTLRRVGLVARIAAALDQPVASVLTLWSRMDSWGSDSLYLRLFENRNVARIDASDPTEFDLDAASYDPANPYHRPSSGFGELLRSDDKLADHLPRVRAALRISAADLDALWAHAANAGEIASQVPAQPGAGAKLTLANLTVLHRYTVLANGLGLRIPDLLALLALTGAEPFGSPASTLDFLELAGVVSASGFSVAALDYLYRHVAAPGQGPAPSDSLVRDAMTKVWAALRAVRQDTAVSDDPDGTLLATRLAVLQPPQVVASILDALDPGKGLDPATRAQGLRDHLGPTLGGAEQIVLPPTHPDPDPGADDFPVLAAQRKRDNQAAILALVSAWLRRSLGRSSVISVVASSLGLGDSMTRRLLVDWIPGDTGSALDSLLALDGGGLTRHAFSAPGFAGTESVDAGAVVAAQTTADGELHSARWTGHVLPLGDGDHVFVIRSDGAVTLSVGAATKVVAAAPAVADTELTVALTASRLVPITIAYDGGPGASRLELLWRLGTAPAAQPVPPESLFPEGGLAALDDGHGPGHAWRRAHKAALLIAGFGLSEAEVDLAESDDQPFGAFHLRDLPMAAPAPAALHAQLHYWQQLAAFVAVRRALPDSDVTLADVLARRDPEARLAGWAQRLCDATGWDVGTVVSLLDASALADADWATSSATTIFARLLHTVAGPVDPAGAFDLGARLAALERCIELIRRVGVSAATLRSWTDGAPSAADADEVIKAVRARYPDDAEWFEVARTRNDALRQQQRDALVAHTMAHLRIEGAPPNDVNALFEHFLIDVEMCACGTTSRVKQAISSVQLFIQRIMLGLEAGISPRKIDPDRWEWNAEYRIWQANREIFLYPENWIDPELRVDKTPLFADLQSDLSQGPLDRDTIEKAFRGYLDKLAELSRLKICAVHWQREVGTESDSALAPDDSIDKLHVVARTLGAHPTYYYRTLLGASGGNGGTEWTPWEKVDVDIQGDGDSGDVHMLLATFDRRLYLFWALFTDTPEPSQPGGKQGESPPPPLTHWDVRIAWSTYRGGAWSPKQVTSDSIRSNRFISPDHSNHGDHGDLKAFKDAVKEFEAEARQARASYRASVAMLATAELTIMPLLAMLGKSFVAIWGAAAAGHHLSPSDLVAITDQTIVLGGTTLPMIEKLCTARHQSFEQFLSDLFDLVDGWPGGNLTPPQDDILDVYHSIKSLRGKRDAAKERHDKLHKAVKDFKAGKSALAVPAYTRRADHTLWLSTRGGGIDLYLLRHDESSNPLNLGVFSLSDDGRSMAADSANVRLDISRQMPHHSAPHINAFTIETHHHKGLDLEGLPDLLGKVHNASFHHEHWLYHPVTADHPRPFFLAKSSEVHVALPNIKHGVARRWNAAAPRGGVARSSPPPAGAARLLAAAPSRSFEELVTAPGSFGLTAVGANPPPSTRRKKYCFEPFHHPFTHSLIKRLERDGIDGVLSIRAQNPANHDHGEPGGHFDGRFDPAGKFVTRPYSPYNIDFRPQGPYSQYNWELFFHAPYLIAARLMQDGRYDDARRWLHYIFNPTAAPTDDVAVPDTFWKLQWFRDHSGGIDAEQLMTALARNAPDDLVARIHAQIEQWQRHPADPHRIAGLRTAAYRKAIVFKYLDNLIAWADSLFTQNTIETINQATQLYVFASNLLGPRPQHIPQKAEIAPFSYHDLRGGLDDMSDMLAIVESTLHPHATQHGAIARPVAHALLGISHLPVTFQPQPAAPADGTGPSRPRALTFCVPANAKLGTYFDTIDDRLFKIRNCMNIEGIVQQLPLFEPPIDPALLVRAAAMGLDIGSILSDLSAPLPFHRFATMLQKANEVCNEVKALGAQLLSALEKKDAESLSVLRASHEASLLSAIRDVKKQQLADARTAKQALESSRIVTKAKHDYYASREFMNSWENEQSDLMGAGGALHIAGGTTIAAASAMWAFPDFEIGPTGMGVHATAKGGGSSIANGVKAVGEGLNVAAQALKDDATMAGILGGHHRRKDEWDFQKDLAHKELAQIDKQLVAADIKIAIATLELNNHQLQIDHARKIETTLRTKYTNSELYQWMITQISTVHYQAYKLAYELAKRAERCYRYELGVASSSFIQFGHWDSLRRGLLAGEQLALDLKRLDAAYLHADRRDFEITRQVSLVLHDPAAFIALRETGSCTWELPEELFDSDYPGHYFRRLKTVSVTLPCVAGPYTPINCTLTLLRSSVRISPTRSSKASGYPEHDQPNDPRFSRSYGAIQSVATSHGQNDAGLFELNFRDDRYLPFEGAGAISRWRVDLPKDCNAFDFDTLSDVVIKLSYTARDGGAPLAHSARQWLAAQRNSVTADEGITPSTPLQRLFRVRYEFSDRWIEFRNALARGAATLSLPLDIERFPYRFRGAAIAIAGVKLFATTTEDVAAFGVSLAPPTGDAAKLQLTPTRPDPTFLTSDARWPASPGTTVTVGSGAATAWSIAAAADAPIAKLRDLLVLVTYTAKTAAVT